MGCCGAKNFSKPKGINEVTLLRIPGAVVHLMHDGDVVELARGDLTVVRITDKDTVLATVVRVRHDLGWPLTKDEPVVKIDDLHYLFTLPDKDGEFLNYGVSFMAGHGDLASLDVFLKDNTCFSTPLPTATAKSSSSKGKSSSYGVEWKDYAPKIEDYNGLLAKAIAGGTGEIVKGIFMCSNAYSSQVRKGADLIQPQAAGRKATGLDGKEANRKRGEINNSIKRIEHLGVFRVRKISEMTEKMSQSLLNVVITVTGSIAVPLLQSKTGKSFLSMVPGQVLLASLDAINKVMDAVEAAERQTLTATSGVVAGAVSKRFGESAGEATEDVFATAGHAVGTAWNLFKIRKAITPNSSLPSTMLKNAVKNRT
ncbi:protein EARLY-RESPONSIVE TO DEHYDRATION 7, chloroplastic-like isoform X1 [Typha latifolia]|uniref:protein EARLY-RESPONSIVE TO DEHYDRATION 7, chloroplastic-like isoform X1 n=1 Tax=Typha latifolia TaxID=4733 RepID=UPI003C30DB8F